jgi:hypothetical protein
MFNMIGKLIETVPLLLELFNQLLLIGEDIELGFNVPVARPSSEIRRPDDVDVLVDFI